MNCIGKGWFISNSAAIKFSGIEAGKEQQLATCMYSQ